MKELALTTALVILIDMSDLMPTIKRKLSRIFKLPIKSIKPFDCSFCMTIYVILTYHLFNHTMTVYTFTYAFILAFSTPIIQEVLLTIKDFIIKILRKIC